MGRSYVLDRDAKMRQPVRHEPSEDTQYEECQNH